MKRKFYYLKKKLIFIIDLKNQILESKCLKLKPIKILESNFLPSSPLFPLFPIPPFHFCTQDHIFLTTSPVIHIPPKELLIEIAFFFFYKDLTRKDIFSFLFISWSNSSFCSSFRIFSFFDFFSARHLFRCRFFFSFW